MRRIWSAAVATAALLAVGGVLAPPAHASEDPTPAELVAQMTGPGSVSSTDTQWAVTGTDLGVMWDNGDGEVLTALGDTFGAWTGPGGGGGDWRSNVLLRSTDTDLSDGMTFDSAVEDVPGHAAEIIPSQKINGVEMTTIPTAGIAVDGRQYLAFMSVRQWGAPGEWSTNYSRIAYSDDNGETWNSTDGPTWTNTEDGTHPFQMVAFERHGGYLYMFGTPNGRFGAAHVARVPEAQILDTSAYRYWDGAAWTPGDGTHASSVVDPNVAELSVRYDTERDLWLMTYLDQHLDIVLRTAETPTGPWSERQVLVSFADYPGLYGGFMHPWSTGDDLYLAVSLWDPYNVYLMRVALDGDGQLVDPNLITDPSFERATDRTMPAPWECTGSCGVDINHSWAYAGTDQGWMRAASGWIDIHQQVAVEPYTTYTFSAYVVTGGAPGDGEMGVRIPGAGGEILASTEFQQLGEYTRLEVTFNSGAHTDVEAFVGTHLDGDRWVQIDDLGVFRAAEQPPVWQLTTTTDPPDGTAVKNGSRIAYAVTATAQQPVIATIEIDLSDASDDGRVSKPAATSGTLVVDGDSLIWTGEVGPDAPVTITWRVQAKSGSGDHDLSVVVGGDADGALLAGCSGCETHFPVVPK